jgi:aminopeptidase-like protein
LPFTPYGYDERQYCSPGFDLPVGCLMRSPHGTFPEYHTSADNLDFVHPDQLAGSLATLLEIVEVLESDRTYVNQQPFGEPQLGKRGLYRSTGGHTDAGMDELPMLWALNQSDGSRSLLDIAERSSISFARIKLAVDALVEVDLLRPVDTL